MTGPDESLSHTHEPSSRPNLAPPYPRTRFVHDTIVGKLDQCCRGLRDRLVAWLFYNHPLDRDVFEATKPRFFRDFIASVASQFLILRELENIVIRCTKLDGCYRNNCFDALAPGLDCSCAGESILVLSLVGMGQPGKDSC